MGIFFEGEMVMISSVIAAHHGYLNIWVVIIIGIIGTYTSDCFYFFLGRKKGREWLLKKRRIKGKISLVDRQIEKYPVLIFIIYRFLYGFRTIIPLVIGATSTRTSKFLLFVGLSTLIWAATFCTIGYIFGEVIKSRLSHIEHIEKYIIGAIALAGILLILLNQLRKRERTLPNNGLGTGNPVGL